MKLDEIDSSQFSYQIHASGSIHDIIDGPCRTWNITRETCKEMIRKYAIGYCDASYLSFKPKVGEFAIMCFKDGKHLWFHLRKIEFEEVFK